MNDLLSSGRLWRMCLKELRETLRDRRTVTTLLLMPILVYPLLSITLQRLLLTSSPSGPEPSFLLGVASSEEGEAILDAIKSGQALLQERPYQPIRINRQPPLTVKQDDANQAIVGADVDVPHFELHTLTDSLETKSIDPLNDTAKEELIEKALNKALRDAVIDVIVRARKLPNQSNFANNWVPYRFQLTFVQGDARSEQAVQQLRRLMQVINDVQDVRLRKANRLAETAAVELIADSISLKSDSSTSLATIIPLVLVLMTITGAVYPAIDLTAGERERGTMEALIASPVPRFALLFSKYAAVITVAVLTALANLSAMWITLSASGLGEALLGKQGFSIVAVLQILPLLVIFACFFSAILLALCSFARSFKEAQAYLIPVMLFSLAPGVVSLMPGIHFTPTLAVVPLVNIVLLAREILTGPVPAVPALVAVASTLIYAAAALSIAARLFGTDASLQGGQATWSDLLRPPKQWQMVPSLEQLAIYLACFYPVYFIVTNLVGRLENLSLTQRLGVNSLVLLVGFLLIPWAFARLCHIRITSAFRLSKGHGWLIPTAVGVILMSVSSWMAEWELHVLVQWLKWVTIREDQLEAVARVKNEFQSLSLWIILASMALVPAICEEFFFRGFALSALFKFSRTRAVIFSAILFGAFHVITGSVLSIERFLPTTFLGLIAGFVAIRTGALWPGILLHACHNGIVLTLAHNEKALAARGWGVQEQVNLPLLWLAAGALVFAIGTVVFWLGTRNQPVAATSLQDARNQ